MLLAQSQSKLEEVLKLVFEKNELFFHRWREIQLFGFPGWAEGAEIEDVRKKAEAKADDQIAERGSGN